MESLKFPTTRIHPIHFKSKEAMQKLLKGVKQCSILIDEAHLWLDSRNSKKNTGATLFVSQCRKLLKEQGDFFYTTQFPNQVDKRLRYNTTLYMYSQKRVIEENTFFEVKVNQPSGDWTEEINSFRINANGIFDLNLYDKFEIVDVEE